MPGKTFKTHALVLRKTKLGESDLIVTLLDDTGAIVRAVAKGARKPGGSLASRIELFSEVNALIAQGKSLGVLTETRLSNGAASPLGLEQTACASAIAELASTVAQEGLEQERLFAMTAAAFDVLRECDETASLAVCAGALLKVVSQAGFRPRFDACAACGQPQTGAGRGMTWFSFEDGGALCDSCRRLSEVVTVETDTVNWSAYLLASRFSEIVEAETDVRASFDVLQLARQWIRVHTGRNMKSLDFLFTSGLF